MFINATYPEIPQYLKNLVVRVKKERPTLMIMKDSIQVSCLAYTYENLDRCSIVDPH